MGLVYIVEEWRWAVGYEGLYSVSSIGRVASYRRRAHAMPVEPEPQAIMKGSPHSEGYRYVTLRKDGTPRQRYIHDLVARAFIGPPAPGQECRHLDGNPKNNSACNLAWGTRRENILDRRAHGTASRFLISDIAAIRERAKSGETQKSIAASYQTHQSCISRLLRRAW